MVIVNCSPPPRANISSTARAPAIPLPITTKRCLWVIAFSLYLFHAHRADFEFRHFRDRIEGRISQQVDTGSVTPVKWHKHRVEPDRRRQSRMDDRYPAPRGQA